MSRMKQTEIVLGHLTDAGPLTAREALVSYGIMRLAARVHELREAGYTIETRTRKVKNRFGEKVGVAEYYIPEGQQEMAL